VSLSFNEAVAPLLQRRGPRGGSPSSDGFQKGTPGITAADV